MPKYLRSILVIALVFLTVDVFLTKGASIDNDVARAIHTRFKDKSITEWKAAASDYMHRNRLDSAHICYSYIAQITGKGSTREEREIYATALNGLGVIYYLYGNYAQAYTMFSNAVKENPDYVDAYQNLAAIYWLFGQYDKSVKQLDRAFRMQFEHGSQYNAITAYVNMVNILIEHGPIENIDTLINTFENYPKNQDNPLTVYANCLNKGATAMARKQYGKAIRFFKESYPQFSKIDPRLEISMRHNISKAFHYCNENDSSLAYLLSSLDIAKQYHFDDMQIATGKQIAEALDEMGLHNEAKNYRYDALLLADSISNFADYASIMDMEFQSEVNQYKDKIEKTVSERKTQTVILIIVSIITIIVVAMFWGLLRQMKLLKLKDQKLFNQIITPRSAATTSGLISESPVKSNRNNKNGPETSEQDSAEKTYKNKIDPERESRLVKSIQEIMSVEANYLSPDFSLSMLAHLTGDTVKNVSQVVNDKFGKTFATFLNEYRIQAALRKMNDSRYDHYTIDAISEELGFKSRSHFSKVFTAVTGMSPTTYRKLRNKPSKDTPGPDIDCKTTD